MNPMESASIKRLTCPAEVEFLAAHYTHHAFEPHWHDTWAVGVVLKGAHDNSAKRDGSGVVAQGQVTLIEPGHVHAGHAIGSTPCEYLMLYLPDTLLSATECWQQGPRSVVRRHGFHAPKLADGLVAACSLDGADYATEGFHADVIWTDLINTLVSELTDPRDAGAERAGRSISHVADRARQYLHDNISHPFSLDQLAGAVGISKYHLCRLFTASFGMSAQQYLRQIRVQCARNLLRRTASLSDVAFKSGFADQSHLGRVFKQAYGVTPGAYAAATR